MLRKNAFFYGCSDEKDPTAPRILPFIFSKLTEMFSYKDCSFQIHKSKEKTARIALWNEYKIPNIFTLEASFFGYDTVKGAVHYTQDDYMSIGKYLCKALYVYLCQIKLGLIQRLIDIDSLRPPSATKKKSAFKMEGDSGSDSNPSDDDLPDSQLAKLLPKSVINVKSKKTLKSASPKKN